MQSKHEIATAQNFEELLNAHADRKVVSLDTETTGLKETDRVFSIILTSRNAEGVYIATYFNWNSRPDYQGNRPPQGHTLPREAMKKFKCLEQWDTLFPMHNAKFDLRMLGYEDIDLAPKTVCTQTLGRLHHNTHMRYTLSACASRIGEAKDDEVEKCISKNKLYTWEAIPNKKRRDKLKHFDLVPFDIISNYGCIDGIVTLKLYEHFTADIDPRSKKVYVNERNLTETCFKIERRGVRIDRAYVANALDWELGKVDEQKQIFKELTGINYGNGGTKILGQVFQDIGMKLLKTEKGNLCFNKKALKSYETPIARAVESIRNHEKNISTYYSSFLHFADEYDIIRPSMRQDGTETGRFSYSNPNLQNIPKEEDGSSEEHPFLVRSSFVPRDHYCFVMIDYDQQEFRLMLDYCGQHDVIKRINEGEDVHQVTAEMLGVKRSTAKTNF